MNLSLLSDIVFLRTERLRHILFFRNYLRRAALINEWLQFSFKFFNDYFNKNYQKPNFERYSLLFSKITIQN